MSGNPYVYIHMMIPRLEIERERIVPLREQYGNEVEPFIFEFYQVKVLIKLCDRIWQNPAYGIHALFAQCMLLVPQVKKCQSWVFVIYMPKNLSTNLCRRLRRLTVSYKGEVSLHFNLPSLYSYRTRSLLLWALVRLLYLDTARFIELLYVCSPF